MNENIKDLTTQISSVDIIKKSNISRATLNNYIKMGILPHPVVTKPDGNTSSKAKRMGYFPYSVLDTLDKIIQYKKEGRRMVEICRLLTQRSIRSSESIQSKETVDDTEKTFFQRRSSGYESETGELFSFNQNHTEYVPADTVTNRDIKILLRQGALTLVNFSVLVAELQNVTKICADLPPEEYLRLIRRIWKSMTSIFKKYSGIYGKHTGNGIVFYFLKDRDSSYLMSAIVCALELRKMMKRVNQEWKMSIGCFDDLYLNIGISEGHEFLASIPAPTVEFISLGDSVNSARQLSDFACSGSIWTTKNLLTRLDEKDRRQIRYGIYRKEQNREVLAENFFSRVMDLIPQDNLRYSKYMDIWTLPVTEIQRLC